MPSAADVEKRGRRSRYYQLTELGKEVVAAEAERLARLLGVAHQKHMLASASLPTITATALRRK